MQLLRKAQYTPAGDQIKTKHTQTLDMDDPPAVQSELMQSGFIRSSKQNKK